MSNSVYCMNCRHSDPADTYFTDKNRCYRRHRAITINRYTGLFMEKIDTRDSNIVGYCKHYKRNWWKFWVKEKEYISPVDLNGSGRCG